MRTRIFILAIVLALCAGAAFAQDDQSLGDLARQQRQQREQSKTAKTTDAKPAKVITNADLPSHSDESTAEASDASKPDMPVPSNGEKPSSENVKSQIQEQKSQIAELQKQIDEVNASIRFAPGNCVRNCEQWNQHQEQKQQQVERMQSQLEEQKKQLEEMQESARKQGFGSSVYDP
jgi:chromosome segregation ATPase